MMEEFVREIVQAVERAFGVGLDAKGQCREVSMARRAAALLCVRNGIPARFLAEATGRSRWTVNRWASDALNEGGVYFRRKLDEVEGTIKAQNDNG